MSQKLSNDSVHWYMSEMTSRIIAESGIPSDRHHLGKIILRSFKDDPEFVLQIDGATGESETYRSALQRTVRCATGFRHLGLDQGDVVVVMAPNHLDVAIPFYAALYLGVIVAVVDRTLTSNELEGTFSTLTPKVVFCQSERATDVQLTLNQLNMNTQIVTFDKGDYLLSFAEFIEDYGDDTSVEDFKAADFDPEETTAFLIPTSGTTGLPKAAAVTHKNFAVALPYNWTSYYNFPSPVPTTLLCAPLQWLTALITLLGSQILRYTRIQSSQNVTQQHAYHLINTYRPAFAIISPTMLTNLIRPGDRDQCDFTCFERLYLGGSAVPRDLIEEMELISPDTAYRVVYGMTEVCGYAFFSEHPEPGSCGQPLGCFQYRLVNLETQEDIHEPNRSGELWLKGPTVFKEYYKNPDMTADSLDEDRWFKTGDIFYRDANWNFFFVERIKLLLKYKSYQISPVEVESVIRQHPGVLDAAVAGIPDPECGDLAVACVVRRQGSDVTAQEIKDLVKESLSDSKQLRGGVIFMDTLPMTASTKVHRRNLKEMVLVMDRE